MHGQNHGSVNQNVYLSTLKADFKNIIRTELKLHDTIKTDIYPISFPMPTVTALSQNHSISTIRFCYHNHAIIFKIFDGSIKPETILQLR